MSSLVDILPQETIDGIVDCVSVLPQARRALVALVRTSREFQHRSRAHLYRKLAIKQVGPEDNASLQRAVDHVKNNPQVLRYVKELRFRYHLKKIALEERGTTNNLRWRLNHAKEGQALIILLLKEMHSLEVLDVTNHGLKLGNESQVKWSEMEGGIVLELWAIVKRSSRTLQTLKMNGIDVIPITLLLQLENLANLTLGPSARLSEIGTADLQQIRWKLKTLFASSSVLSISPGSPFALAMYSNLTHLRLLFDQPRWYMYGWKAILGASSTLEALVMEYHKDKRSFFEDVIEENTVIRFPRLRLLSLTLFPLFEEVGILTKAEVIALGPVLLCKIFGVGEFPALQMINVVAHMPLGQTDYVQIAREGLICHNDGWAKLARMLADGEIIPRLRAVGFVLHPDLIPQGDWEDEDMSENGEDLYEQIWEEIRGVFKALHERDDIYVGPCAVVNQLELYRQIMSAF